MSTLKFSYIDLYWVTMCPKNVTYWVTESQMRQSDQCQMLVAWVFEHLNIILVATFYSILPVSFEFDVDFYPSQAWVGKIKCRIES